MTIRKKTLLLFASPCANGNTRRLVKQSLGDFAFDELTEINLYEKRIGDCLGCGGCSFMPCMLLDDVREIIAAIDGCELLIVAAPVFFSSVPGRLKTLIDRCQCRWAETYGKDEPPEKCRDGLILATKGTAAGEETAFRAPLTQFMNLFGARGAQFYIAGGTDEGEAELDRCAAAASQWLRCRGEA